MGINLCQTFCTSTDGLSEYTCDNGETCVPPAYPLGSPAIELDPQGNTLLCDSEPSVCDSTNGFACDPEAFTDADVCTRVRRICTP